MKASKLNQRGIAHTGIILAIIVIAVMGLAIYRVMSKDNKAQTDSSTQQQIPKQSSKKAVSGDTVYNFNNSLLQIDLPKGWEVKTGKYFDQNGDSVKESYGGTIDGPDGWTISFAFDQGGFGGGPGCNIDNNSPDLPKCPLYKVVTKKKLQTGDYLYHYSLYQSSPAQTGGSLKELAHNCVIVSSVGEGAKIEADGTFEADGWVCHPYIQLKGATVKNGKPSEARFSIVFPRGLDNSDTTDYMNEPGFTQAIKILESLRNR